MCACVHVCVRGDFLIHAQIEGILSIPLYVPDTKIETEKSWGLLLSILGFSSPASLLSRIY